MPDAPKADAATTEPTAAADSSAAAPARGDAGPDSSAAGAPDEVKNSFREALARKAGRNSHVESHLDGRHIGGGNNDTHKRQFRRKSG